jgi:hypothetical protein
VGLKQGKDIKSAANSILQLIERFFWSSCSVLHSWTSRLHPKRGLGWVECAASPPDMAVVHRCPCNDSACADEEVAVQQLTRYGLMLYN